MPRVGFEPMTPMSEQVQTFHALDRSAAVIGGGVIYTHQESIFEASV
jgi:hypothetical protein